MAHRTFLDNNGRRWDVWSIKPTFSGMESWLCFETEGEKRRLREFPPDWEARTDGELCELCGVAEPAPAPRRLLE
jgi:hypothetical protein